MAYINWEGIVDDCSQDLSVAGNVNVGGLYTSSMGSFGKLVSTNNYNVTQMLANSSVFYAISEWDTAKNFSSGITAHTSSISSGFSGSILVNQAGWYLSSCVLSFSGSSGPYTFAVFVNGSQDTDSAQQTYIPSIGPAYAVNASIEHFAWSNAGDVIDVRVKYGSSFGSFNMGFGHFTVVRQVG